MPVAPCRIVAAGAGDWIRFWALTDRQKTNSTNEQEATSDSATLAPPDPEVVEPNGNGAAATCRRSLRRWDSASGARGPRPSP